MLTPAQARMARAALNWSLLDVQERIGINKNTVVRFEAGKGVLLSTALKLEDAFAKEGLVFTHENDVRGQGVFFSSDLTKKLGGSTQSAWKRKSEKRSQKAK